MKLTQQQIAKARKVYDLYWDSYHIGDVDTFATTLDDNFEMIGTSESEICHNKMDGIEFFKGQADEVIGKAEMRNRQINAIPVGGLVLVNELCDIYILAGTEWAFYSKIRISTFLHETPSGWKVVQQHGSLPDTRVQDGETLAFDRISRENLELRDAIRRGTIELENKNRELEIEAALERVRAKAMSMQKSEDLRTVVVILYEQLKNLGFQWGVASIVIMDPDSGDMDWWMEGLGDGFVLPERYHVPYFEHSGHLQQLENWKSGRPYAEIEISGQEKKTFDTYYFYQTDFSHAPEPSKQLMMQSESVRFSMAFMKYGALSWAPTPLLKEQANILERFANVFEQCYTRFLDLQKAEAQAREAQIEAALERVRSRSLAMHKTDELQEVVRVVAEELKNTGVILDTGGAVICTYFQDSKDVIHWTATDDPAHPSVPYLLPYFKDELFDEAWASKNSGDDYFAKEFSYDVKNAFFNYAFEHSDYRQLPDEYKKIILESKSHGLAFAWSKNSAVMIPSIQGDLPSEEEKEILIRFAKVFEQSFIRFLDLHKAEAQAREAQIEASLEKVRAHTMGMQSSEDLSKVASVMFEQMKNLGGDLFAFGIVLCDRQKNVVEQWHNLGNEGMMSPFSVPVDLDYIHRYRYDQWKAGEELFSIEIPEDYIVQHFELMFELPSVKATMDEVADQGIQVDIPDWEIDYGASFKHGYLLVSSLKPFKEYHIFPRFAKVFDQAYTRFMDLQKAEAQAREAKIELSMERIRAQVTAMQESSDLLDIVVTMRTEFVTLGHEAHYFWHMRWLPDKYEKAMTSGDGTRIGMVMSLPRHIHGDIKLVADWEKSDEPTVVLAMDVETAVDYVEKMITLGDFQQVDPQAPTLDDIRHIGGLTFIMARTTHGEIGFSLPGTVPNPPIEAVATLARFAGVFDLAYRRFEDLKSAERQQREAEIELALERVRGKTMAMQHSDELKDAAALLFQQVQKLGVKPWSCGFNIWEKDKSAVTAWLSPSQGGVQPPLRMPRTENHIWSATLNAYERGETLYVGEISGKELEDQWKYLSTIPGFQDMVNNSENAGFSLPLFEVHHAAFFSYGFLLFVTLEPCPEAHEIFKRFAQVFEQTYTRFLDLKKAEAQAREANKQASLDRVRGEIASMRSAKDLEIITPLVWNELTTLGIPFIRCGVFIIHEEEEQVEVYLSKPDGTSLAVMHLPFGASDLAVQTVDAWQKGSVYTQHWNREDFLNYGRIMIEQGQIPDMETYRGTEEAPESLNLHFIPFNQGMLYVGATETLSDGEIGLAASLAETFSIAYARYEDFVKLEKAKAGIEEALTQLKATQSQLVQQEKLASLGQLTAGIAHEIKNPLNFVNNFSEVSIEMVDEAREEVKRETADGKRQKEDVLTILDDIEANLRKIHEHGSRADGIVKSMLQHSRGGSGKMESTDLNAFIKEYVNLAFHGMRAGKDPINVDIDLQLDDSIGEVPLVIEDFSRVILNLCNNAFDAMREKMTGDGGPETGYVPKLTVRTKPENDHITIEIEDNGPGIPEAIKDKILQPFFTTKKGTQGTGLGLSITNDIVKAHGGRLEIESRIGEYTTFTVQLPLNTNDI
jgi:signal transduction histidine kinase